MAQQHLDDPDVGALLQQVGGEAVAQGVQRDARLAEGRGRRRRMAGAIELTGGDRLGRVAAGEVATLAAGPPATQVRSSASIGREAWTQRSLRPLPCSTRISMRWLSMSPILRWTISLTHAGLRR